MREHDGPAGKRAIDEEACMLDAGNALERHMRDIWTARGAVLVTAALNALLINKLTVFPWWLASAVEVALLAPLSVATAWTHDRMRRATDEHHWLRIERARRLVRHAAMFLTAIVTLINFHSLLVVLRALLEGAKQATGQSLLVDALNIWFTNVVVFALWFWNLDSGGPAVPGSAKEPAADFLFPQMSADCPGHHGWRPGFFDYLFVSFTNATAFSPTDTMPLTVRVKLLFMVQSIASLLTVGMVAARAVNILS
ncbi:hypothetical protein [Massilia sp. GCM10023247]|uniref:hypothetical protein n=1 Tax=Massilia sp. GCM10023247 TaxID=3252643 RepID=UPI0036D20AA3